MFPQMDRHRQARQTGLAADVRRLPVRQPDQRDGVLPHRHHAAGALGQGDDGGAGMVALTTAGARNRKGGERFGLTVQPENRSTFAVMGIATTELTPVEQTAFLTQYARALDSRWPRPILGDTLADEVVGKIDYDFAGLGVQTSVVCQTALRAKMLDDRVRDFRQDAPRRGRRGPGRRSGQRLLPRRPAAVAWTGTASTCPGVTALRDEVLPANPHSHSVPVSLADEHWPDTIPADRPTMLVADGLFAFLLRAGDRRHLPPDHRPFPLRRAGVQRLRPHRLVQPHRDQAVPAEDVQGRRTASGATRDSRTPTIPRRGTRG